MNVYYESLKSRLENKLEKDKSEVSEMLAEIAKNCESDPDYYKAIEEDRIWLDQFAKGKGLNICCGFFSIGDSLGVDITSNRLAVHQIARGDELTFQETGTLDFIVTNYIDAMPTPLKALNEWNRCLKPGGKLAIIAADADSYDPLDRYGALRNGRRSTTYTKTTLSHYLWRAGFRDLSVEVTNHKTLRALARKE